MGVPRPVPPENTGKMRVQGAVLRTYNAGRTARGRIAPPRSWDDTVTRFIDHHRTRRRSELTLRWYAADLAAFAAWHREARGADPSLESIDAEGLLNFRDHLEARTIEAGGGAEAEADDDQPSALGREVPRRLGDQERLPRDAARPAAQPGPAPAGDQ